MTHNLVSANNRRNARRMRKVMTDAVSVDYLLSTEQRGLSEARSSHGPGRIGGSRRSLLQHWRLAKAEVTFDLPP
ncbi:MULTISPECIES: hypothetical protein [unclassified Mesorhizobium]|uniref:hypothetical protein n=1 Tax=unclassified Mesorhizobium TaxID=325217 RepID=UPI0015E3B682|nr:MULTISPECIES: hypothetical protein [unclassified Mesorhizobium]